MTNDINKINFNAYWQYYSTDKIRIFDDIKSLADSSWLSIRLPHIIKDFNGIQYWYRKKFNWDLLSKNDREKVYLEFDSMNIDILIWINGINIQLNKKIEITNYLIKNKNTLIVCCQDQTLSLHINLLIENETKKLDCTVQLDDDNGRFDINFDSSSILSLSSYDNDSLDHENKLDNNTTVPYLTIVILIVGTRGDVQPFIALGKSLKAYGHRIRLATHEPFREFIRENGLEFYPLAGDPSDLMSFMVKNAGIIPSFSSIVSGDISKHRQILTDILKSTWLACTANDDETGLIFTAEAIIANPPSFGHIHCAEKLQIPLHIMFTMPWSPTRAFPHPLCNIDSSKEPAEKKNYYSYQAIEMLTWSGMKKIINNFRKNILGLSPLHTHEAINLLVDQHVPHTYCWSKALAAKPVDWESHIDVSGFFFLNLCSNYTNPPEDLVQFLVANNKPKPIYIGFGSITGHDCKRILQVVIDALEQTGYRAVLSGLANDSDFLPENIFKIGNIPHDWLFEYVSAVCHHGGAGTTAAGLRAGKPTIIVPFFGDQFFWGNIIERSGAGPRPLPGKSIIAEELADAFRFVHQPSTCIAAEKIQLAMKKENGCEAAVQSFHSHLPLDRMRSDLDSTYAACYRINELNLQVSQPVANVLVSAGLINMSQLKSHFTRQWKFNYNRYIYTLSRRNSDSSSSSTDEEDEIDSKHNETSSQELNPMNNQQNINSSKSIKQTLWRNKKLAVIHFLKTSRTHIYHHPQSTDNNTLKTLILAGDCAIQPTVSALPGAAWLGHSIDTVEKIVHDSRNDTSSTSSLTIDNERQHSNIDPTAKIASMLSGLSLETTQKILFECEKIQNERKQSIIISKPKFERQRSHSTSTIE